MAGWLAQDKTLLLTLCVCVALPAHTQRLCATARDDGQRAAFHRVVEIWQDRVGLPRLLSTQQVALLADVMYKTFTERGLTGAVVRAPGEYCYAHGQEPWRPTNDIIPFTQRNVEAIIDSLVELFVASSTVYGARFMGDYSDLSARLGKGFYRAAIPHFLTLCTNDALVKNAEARNVLAIVGYRIQQHGIITGGMRMAGMFLDTVRIVALQNGIERVHELNIWPEPYGTYGTIVPAGEIKRRIQCETNRTVIACLFEYLFRQDTKEAYDYYAGHARAYYRDARDAYWQEHLRQYRQRVIAAEQRRKREALEHKGIDVKATRQKEYNELLQRLDELRAGPPSARAAGEYWRVLKTLDGRRAEWEAADICFEEDEFVALATNYVSPAARRIVYVEALNTAHYTPAKRYIPLAAATVLGMIAEPADIAGLVKHVNKAKPMRVLMYEDDELTDAESGGRIDVFLSVVQSAAGHGRRAALEALAGQVAALRDPWVREVVRDLLQRAKIAVPEGAPPANTEYFHLE